MSRVASGKTRKDGGSPALAAHPLPRPWSVLTVAWQHRRLIRSMASREIATRYKGSLLGGLWTFLMPLLMIAMFSFVFGVVFQSRFEQPPGKHVPFGLLLFAGMIWANVFVECLGRSPVLMMENPAYIKKVVFPLEIMPYVALVSASFTAVTSLAVLALFYVAAMGVPPWTIVFLPVVVAPLLLLSLGVMWFLGSLGVYLRDLRQVMGVVTTAVVFLSPQFYPLTMLTKRLPDWATAVVWLNPLTLMLEEVRAVMFWGDMPNWLGLGVYTLVAWAIAWGGLAWYSKVHRGFADVL